MENALVGPGIAGPKHEVDPALEHLKRAAENAPIGMFCVCGATGRYVFANAAFARLIGRPLDEILSSDAYQIAVSSSHPDDKMGFVAMQRIAQGEMDTFQYEKRVVRPNGQVIWAEVHMLATRDAEGRLAYLTQYFRDIHAERAAAAERAELETELRQSKKLEALGRLAGGVAHDFNNRLAVILGYSELLRERLPQTEPLIEHVDQVIESAKRATELTRQLLAYSRRQVLKPQLFDLNTTVVRMRSLLERVIGEDIELTTQLDADGAILSDPGQIEQVIMNLAINARDAMTRGGTLALATRNATLGAGEHGALPAGQYIELRVVDSGSGIAEEILPRIFEPFFTTKELGQGTGLGLSTVEGIVTQSGGAVRVDSRVGHGTTFTVLLPRGAAVPAVTRVPAPPPSRRGFGFETVLVCDDDDAVRQLIVDVLQLRGYTIVQARNGRVALELAERHPGPIDLLVTDLVMPQLGGIDLAAALRRKQPQLRVLYLSGYTDDASLLSGVLEPGTLFLPKPFLPNELTSSVTSLLESAPAAD